MRVSLTERALGLLFPPRCMACRQPVSVGESLCPRCRDKLPKGRLCRQLTVDGRAVSVVSAMVYVGAFRESLHRFKFEGKAALGKPMGRLMVSALEETGFDAVVYTPLSARAKRERGYDQSALLAKEVAKQLGLPCLEALRKIRETAVQHELPAAKRRINVQGAYRAEGIVQGKRLLLVDDIVTTGSTLEACAQALYQAGAKAVCCLCAADAPQHDAAPIRERRSLRSLNGTKEPVE